MEKNIDKISWCLLSTNSAAFNLLNSNFDKIIWHKLPENSTKWAMDLLGANPDKIDWRLLALSPFIFKANKERTAELARHLHDNII